MESIYLEKNVHFLTKRTYYLPMKWPTKCSYFFKGGFVYGLVKVGNGNRTEWIHIRSVIIQMIIQSDGRAAGVRFDYHEYDYKQLHVLDEVFVISRIIKVEVGVISRRLRLRLITLTETLIILDITETVSSNCFIIHKTEKEMEVRFLLLH